MTKILIKIQFKLNLLNKKLIKLTLVEIKLWIRKIMLNLWSNQEGVTNPME